MVDKLDLIVEVEQEIIKSVLHSGFFLGITGQLLAICVLTINAA